MPQRPRHALCNWVTLCAQRVSPLLTVWALAAHATATATAETEQAASTPGLPTSPLAPWPMDTRPPFSPSKTQAARQHFKYLCEQEAYTVIHRQVQDVAEVWLRQVRDSHPRLPPSAIWPGPHAAGHPYSGHQLYVLPLLLYEHPTGAYPLSHSVRGFLSGHVSPYPGYQAVHLQDPQSGQHLRLRPDLSKRRFKSSVPLYEIAQQTVDTPWPRYAIQHIDHPTPLEAHFGISRVTLQVIDTAHDEVIAQAQRFAHTGAAVDHPHRLESDVCPAPNWWAYHLRYFVDQVLLPSGRAP